MRVGKTKSEVYFWFNVQKLPVFESSSVSLEKKFLDTRTESYQGGMKSSDGASVSSTDSRKKGDMKNDVPDVFKSTTSSMSSSSVVQVGIPPKF